MRKFIGSGLLLLLCGLLGACGAESTAKKTATAEAVAEIEIVATFYPMYDFTRNIVGEEGNVTLLLPAGTDSHDYEPSAREMALIQDADVFVYNNENMEFWVPNIETALTEGAVTVVKATEGLLLLSGDSCTAADHEHDHSHDHAEAGHSHELDPHVWLAPSLAIKQVESIRDQLIAAYPEHAAAFKKNAAGYLEQLASLDDTYRETLENARQTSFVTQHAAFGYLALEYGLNQVAIAGLSSTEEPSAARLAELKDYVAENGIEYIYFEENAKDSIARTLASEANVELVVLNPLEGLTQKQMDAGENYISIMEANLAALQKTTAKENPLEQKLLTSETEKTVYNGYFEDDAVKDRPLADWSGNWRSVYEELLAGTFDQVYDYKAKLTGKMTAAEYKDYYKTGYATDVAAITITDSTMTFVFEDGTIQEAAYRYAGYEILEYAAGNRGVRYLFEAVESEANKTEPAAFRYVQFSDHAIFPGAAEHFHIYFGNDSQQALLEEVTNWPTYYPAELSGANIAQEMLAH